MGCGAVLFPVVEIWLVAREIPVSDQPAVVSVSMLRSLLENIRVPPRSTEVPRLSTGRSKRPCVCHDLGRAVLTEIFELILVS